MHGPPSCMPCPRIVRALVRLVLSLHGPRFCSPRLIPARSAHLLASSRSCTARAFVRLVLSLHRPPNISIGPVPVSAVQHLVWSCLCVVCALACLASVRPRPCSPCISPVWSAFSLGLVLTCTADFDGSPSCSTGSLHARSAILHALSPYRPRSCLPRLVLALYGPRSCSPRSRTVLSLLLVWSCPCTVHPTARLVRFMRDLCSRLPCPVSLPSAPLLALHYPCLVCFLARPGADLHG